MHRFKKLIAAVLSAVFLTSSALAPDILTLSAMAADATMADEFSNIFPAGVTLYSDTFPGLYVTYDSKESYVIKEGKNEIELVVTLTDNKLAVMSAPALRIIFGAIDIPADKGESTRKKTFVTGVQTDRYAELVLKTGNHSLYELVKGLTSKDAKEAVSAYASFIMKLSQVIQFVQNESSKSDGDEEQERAAQDGGWEDNGHSDDANPEKPLCDRTILIYLDGTNLEREYAFGTKNLLDLLRADMPEGIKIYVVTGGTKTWHMNDQESYRDYVKKMLFPNKYESDLTPAEKARINNMAGDLLSKYGTNISGLQLWEIVSDGAHNRMVNRQTYVGQYITDPKFFSRMIDYAVPEDPEGKYDLIIWDHGAGYGGYGEDELLDAYKQDNPDQEGLPDSTFSLKQMREAIAGSDFIINGGKFDFIGFDACQMANYEVVTTLKGLADYYIGSEENEPGAGWDYHAMINEIDNNPVIDTRVLGAKIVDAYIQQYKGNNESTLSVIDMTGVDELDDAVSNLAVMLLQELEKDDDRYLDLVNNLGKKSHFANRSGYYTSNYLDLKRFATLCASNDLGFSKELRDAGELVLQRLDECVLYNKWLEKDVENGGLSIYFPLAAYYKTEPSESGAVYYNNSASDTVKIYNESDINKDYKIAVARFALLNIAGKLVGEDWKDLNINTPEDLVAQMRDNSNWSANWRVLYETAKVNESDPDNDPTLKNFEKILSERIQKDSITITKPDSDDKPAMVEISKPETLAVGDVVEVKVELFDKDNHYVGSIGNTSLFSQSESSESGKAVYSLEPYDMVWYLLNDQICSMYVTGTSEDGSYQGYIPVCYWQDARSASNLDMNDGESRNEYLRRAERNEKVVTIYLNVKSDEKGENLKVTSYSTVSSSGNVNAADTNLGNLEDSYFELLGGTDNFYGIDDTPTVFSLGTIYYEQKKDLSVTVDYVADVGQSYYISDVYGNDYYLTDYNLGEGKGLDDFYKYYPSEDENGNPIVAMTWEKSLEKAEQVREEAAIQSQNSNSNGSAVGEEIEAAIARGTEPEKAEAVTTDVTTDVTTAVTEADPAEPVESAEPAENPEPVEDPVPVETPEPAEPTVNVEPAKPEIPEGPSETAKPEEPAEA